MGRKKKTETVVEEIKSNGLVDAELKKMIKEPDMTEEEELMNDLLTIDEEDDDKEFDITEVEGDNNTNIIPSYENTIDSYRQQLTNAENDFMRILILTKEVRGVIVVPPRINHYLNEIDKIVKSSIERINNT